MRLLLKRGLFFYLFGIRKFTIIYLKDIVVLYLHTLLLLVISFSFLMFLSTVACLQVRDNPIFNSIITANVKVMLFFITIGLVFGALYIVLYSLETKKKSFIFSGIITTILTFITILYLDLNLIFSIKIISLIIGIIIIIPVIIPLVNKKYGCNVYSVFLPCIAIIYTTLYYFINHESINNFIIHNGLTLGHVVLLYIGLSMLILNNFLSKKIVRSRKEKLQNFYNTVNKLANIYNHFIKNPYKYIGYFLIYVVILQIIWYILGLYLIMDSYFLFYITIMSRVVCMKIVISCILFLNDNPRMWYSTIGMNPLTPILVGFTSLFYFYNVLPFTSKIYFNINNKISNVFIAVSCYMRDIKDCFYNIDVKSLQYICLKLASFLLYPLDNITRYNPGKSLNCFADHLLSETPSVNVSASNRFLPFSFKSFRWLFPKDVHLLNLRNHYILSNKIPRMGIIHKIAIIPDNYITTKVLYVNYKLKDFVRIHDFYKLYSKINLFLANNLKITLSLEDYTVKFKLCKENLVDISVVKYDNKYYSPKDFFNMEDYLTKIKNSSYVKKLNEIVANSNKDIKVFSSHGFDYDFNVINYNPVPYVNMGEFNQAPEMDIDNIDIEKNMNSTDSDSQYSVEPFNRVIEGSNPNYPPIKVEISPHVLDNRNFKTYTLDFDGQTLYNCKWNYLNEILISMREKIINNCTGSSQDSDLEKEMCNRTNLKIDNFYNSKLFDVLLTVMNEELSLKDNYFDINLVDMELINRLESLYDSSSSNDKIESYIKTNELRACAEGISNKFPSIKFRLHYSIEPRIYLDFDISKLQGDDKKDYIDEIASTGRKFILATLNKNLASYLRMSDIHYSTNPHYLSLLYTLKDMYNLDITQTTNTKLFGRSFIEEQSEDNSFYGIPHGDISSNIYGESMAGPSNMAGSSYYNNSSWGDDNLDITQATHTKLFGRSFIEGQSEDNSFYRIPHGDISSNIYGESMAGPSNMAGSSYYNNSSWGDDNLDINNFSIPVSTSRGISSNINPEDPLLITLIDTSNNTAEAYANKIQLRQRNPNLSKIITEDYIDKDKLYYKRYMLKKGFIDGIDNVLRPINLSEEYVDRLTHVYKNRTRKEIMSKITSEIISMIDVVDKTVISYESKKSLCNNTHGLLKKTPEELHNSLRSLTDQNKLLNYRYMFTTEYVEGQISDFGVARDLSDGYISQLNSRLQDFTQSYITVIDLENHKAETFKSNYLVRKDIPGLSSKTLVDFIKKNKIYKNKYIFRYGFLSGVTSCLNVPATLSSDDLARLNY